MDDTYLIEDPGKLPEKKSLVTVAKRGSHTLRGFRSYKKVGDEGEVPFLYQENSAMPGVVFSRRE